MSNLENTALEERLEEAFDIAISEDSALQGDIAYKVLEGWDFYRFCKEDAWDLVDWKEIYLQIKEAFYDCEGSTFDIRSLARKAFNLGEI